MLVSKTSTYGFVFLEVFSSEGGIQSYVRDVLQAYLAQAEAPPADVFVLRDSPTVENPYDWEDGPFTFHYCATSWAMWGRLRLAFTLTRYLIQQRPQRIICGHQRLLGLVSLLCTGANIPYSAITYGKEVWSPLPWRDQRALRQADQIWAISRYSRDRACLANHLDPQRVQLLPCVVDGNRFCPGPANPALVDAYHLRDSRVIMTVARLWSGDRYKGVDVTLRALPAIAEVIPNIKYLVIGRGDDQPRLEALAQGLGIADRVIFAGFVPNAALPAHYRLAQAYVMPSQEGFGIVYLEALACGIPVLAGDQDGSADPLQDGRLGWRVPYQDVNAVATACLAMLSGRDRRCEGAWLRQETLAVFSPPALAHRLSQALALTPAVSHPIPGATTLDATIRCRQHHLTTDYPQHKGEGEDPP